MLLPRAIQQSHDNIFCICFQLLDPEKTHTQKGNKDSALNRQARQRTWISLKLFPFSPITYTHVRPSTCISCDNSLHFGALTLYATAFWKQHRKNFPKLNLSHCEARLYYQEIMRGCRIIMLKILGFHGEDNLYCDFCVVTPCNLVGK
jgi:hypothetical protein